MSLHFDYTAWRQALEEQVARAELEGLEAVVQETAARFRDCYDRAEIARMADELERRYKITGQDARAAFTLIEAYYWDQAIRLQPLRGWIKRFLASLLNYHYPQTTLLLPEQVIFPAPMGDNCPLLAACGQDLAKCRPFCDAHLEAGILANPLEMLLVETMCPQVRWEIEEYRSTPEGRCYYQLVWENPDAPAEEDS
jgi:hypothetical protein